MLHSQPTAAYNDRGDVLAKMATTAHRRYAEIMHDVEDLINDHSTWYPPWIAISTDRKEKSTIKDVAPKSAPS